MWDVAGSQSVPSPAAPMSKLRRSNHPWSIAFATLLMIASAGAVAGEALFASRIYRPDPLPTGVVAWHGAPPVEVEVETADGLTLRGYYWAPSIPGAELIVFFHGNAGNRTSAAQMAEPLAREGKGLLVASYRGFGDNPGTPTEEGLFADGQAFLAKAHSMAPASPIVLFGYSLGGAVALELAASEKVKGVVTLGAFSALRDVAPRVVGGLLKGIYDNAATIKRVEEPILLLHGSADEVVPYAQAKVLQAAAPRARLLRVEGAPHRIALDELAPTVWSNIAQMPD